MDTYLYVLLAMGAVNILLLAAVLVSIRKKRDGGSAEKLQSGIDNLADNVYASGRDANARGEALRTSLTTSLSEMGKKVDDLSQRSYQTALSTMKAMGDMREKTEASDKAQAAAVANAIEKLQLSNEKKLDEMRAIVDEKLTGILTERLDSSFKTVSEQLGNVYRSLGEMREISGGISALNRVLSGVKTRGTWAESQLETILDSTIPGMYVKNYRPDSSRDVVEFAVKIPAQNGGGVTYMPIDSKFPMEDYLRLCNASDNADPEGMRAARKALESHVLLQARAVSKYIVPPATTPFAVLYLATDSLYAEIVSSKDNIVDRVHNECNVLIAGPSTVTALLSSLAMGFRTAALNEKAGEVMDLLAAAKSQYGKFALALDAAKKKIDAASRSIEDASKRNDIILKNLKNVETSDEPEIDAGDPESPNGQLPGSGLED